MLAIVVALKLTSPGPVLYRQERMGVDGRRFRMLKFRTMRVDAEAQTGPVWATPDDPRRTWLGAFLRRWSLDELPQLLNVLRGEMSLVGPDRSGRASSRSSGAACRGTCSGTR